MWVIDGYSLEESCSDDYFVHCNSGWENGGGNGWYRMKMFNNNEENEVELDNLEALDDFDYDKWFRFLIIN